MPGKLAASRVREALVPENGEQLELLVAFGARLLADRRLVGSPAPQQSANWPWRAGARPFGLMFWIIPNGRGRLPHPNRLNQRPSAAGPPELQRNVLPA